MLHAGVRDHVHGIEGPWDYRRCSHRGCGLVWLDPPVLEADLPLLYADYFTHRRSQPAAGAGLRARLARRVRANYVQLRFGLRHANAIGAAAYLFPIRRARLDAEYAHLPRPPHASARLLDIGCGNGERLQRLAACGWSASGIDFDAQAVETCRREGLDVRLGTLQEQRFDAESFDAIVLHHVIEHVADPSAVLGECLRVARPGARLIVVTPNADGALHRVFGRFWRGLEAPRHLRLFAPANLARLCTGSGWVVERRFTSWQMTDGMFAQSWASRRSGSADANGLALRAAGRLAQLALASLAWLRPEIGEEIVFELGKPS